MAAGELLVALATGCSWFVVTERGSKFLTMQSRARMGVVSHTYTQSHTHTHPHNAMVVRRLMHADYAALSAHYSCQLWQPSPSSEGGETPVNMDVKHVYLSIY